MLKRFTTIVATAALALGMASAAMAQDAPRIVVVVHGQAADPFWSVVKNGVDAAQKDTGATVEYRSPATFDMVEMAQLINAAVASKPDGLVVSIPDAAALGDAIKNAVESLKLPKAPANIAKQLAGKCKRIPYDFTWSGKGQAGKVK